MSRAARHSVYLVVAYLTTALLNYAFGVLLSWFFSPAQFGILGVAQSLLLLVALIAGSGFSWTAAQDVAKAGITPDSKKRIRAAWMANAIIGVILGGGVWGIYAVGWLPLGPAYDTVIPLVGLTVALLAGRAVFTGVARGLYRFGAVSVNLAGEVVVKAAVGLGLVAAGLGVTGVLAGFALGAAASFAHSLYVIRDTGFWQGRGWFDRRVVLITIPLFASLLGTALMLNLDVLGLRLLSPGAEGDTLSGFYQAAIILARTPVFLAQALTLVLFSYVAGAQGLAEDASSETAKYLGAAVRSWFRFLVPGSLALALAPQAALILFFPARYQEARTALVIAAVGALLLALVNLLNGVFQAAGDRRRPAVAAGLATLVQVGVLVWLVPDWGPTGAALSLVAAGIAALAMLAPAYSPYADKLLAQIRDRDRVMAVVELLVPLVALALPLVLLPNGGRGPALLKLGTAGATYMITLLVTQLNKIDWDRPARKIVSQLVRAMMGVQA